MYRSKDFSYMEVIHIKNSRVGFVRDLLLDFHKQRITGFEISSYDLVNRRINVMTGDVISFDNSMVIKNTSRGEHLSFNKIKGMDVIDRNGNILGMLEEVLFEERNFIIYGVVLSSGLMNNFLKGKKILLMNELMLGDRNILWSSSSEKLNFSTMPHKVRLMTGGEGN